MQEDMKLVNIKSQFNFNTAKRRVELNWLISVD